MAGGRDRGQGAPDRGPARRLRGLQEASARALDILIHACPPEGANTLPTRLDAVDGRLEAMLQAVSLVSAALEEFYAI